MLRVFIVHGYSATRKSYAVALQEHEYDIAETPENVDVAIIQPPKSGVSSMIDEIRSRSPQARVVFISDNPVLPPDASPMLEKGILVCKEPYRTSELLKLVGEAAATRPIADYQWSAREAHPS